MNSFLGELKRRNVVRVAVLYAVIGWLVLQIADLAMPRLGIPPWGVSLVIMLVVLGFPLALVLAWAFELTPEGIRRTHEVEHHESITHLTGRKLDFLIIGVLAAALLFVVIDSYVLRERGVSRTQAPSTPEGATLISIAVLPFVDMSQAKDQEYLTDGISEELLNVLARVEGFKVAGRTSAFSFKGRDDDLRTIGQKLGVENILEGSVRKQGDRIRVTAQLVKATDGYHLWSDTYDRQLGDVFAIQDDIARQVVGAIRRTLGKDSVTQAVALADDQRPTSNVEAYTHFLRGQHLLRPRERTGMEAALKEFERAVALDPAFARAHVGIANSLALLVNYRHRDLGSTEQRIEAELDRALALQPDLGEAHAVKAIVLAEKLAPASEQIPLLERATAANPSDSQTLVWLAQSYGDIGRAGDEVRTYGRAYAIDPLAPILLMNYALASDRYGDPETTQRLVDELAAVQPGSMMLFDTRAQLGGQAARFDEFIRWNAAQARLDPENAGAYESLAFSYAALGDAAASRRHAARLTALAPGSIRELITRIELKVREGRLADAAALIQAGNRQFGSERDFLLSRAEYETAAGEYEQALRTLLAAMPTFGVREPDVSNFGTFFQSARAMFLYRQGGNEAQADRIAGSAVRYADGVFKPPEGRERGFSLTNRARMAAVSGDRAAVIANLQQLYDTGGGCARLAGGRTLVQAISRGCATCRLARKVRRAARRVAPATRGGRALRSGLPEQAAVRRRFRGNANRQIDGRDFTRARQPGIMPLRASAARRNMYTSFFGLGEKPFAITPDPRYLFLSERHAEALAHLLYGINEAGGFIQLTGEVGTGKTTIVRSLLGQIPKNAEVALILNPRISPAEFLLTICEELRLSVPAADRGSVKELVDILNRHLLATHAEGRRVIVIVDEAQNLSAEVLEQVRLLTNLETATHKLLQIILIGQPELRELLQRVELRQLAQRITGRYHLGPLGRAETAGYVRHRMRVAGATADVFTNGALAEAHRLAGGIPRVINVICDRALLGAYTQDQHLITAALVRRAAGEIYGRAVLPGWARWIALGSGLTGAVLLGIAGWQYLGENRAELFGGGTRTASASAPAPIALAPIPVVKTPTLPELLRARSTDPAGDVAFSRLFDFWGARFTPGSVDGCDQAARQGLECVGQRGSWAQLRALNRPAILFVADDSGIEHQLVLESLGDEHATVDLGKERHRLTIAELSRYWYGDFLLLWRPQVGGAKLLSVGMRGEEVRWLRQSLEKVRGLPSSGGATDVFDTGLTRLVEDFQRQHRLTVDGIAGLQTQMFLDTALAMPGTPFLAPPTAHGG